MSQQIIIDSIVFIRIEWCAVTTIIFRLVTVHLVELISFKRNKLFNRQLNMPTFGGSWPNQIKIEKLLLHYTYRHAMIILNSSRPTSCILLRPRLNTRKYVLELNKYTHVPTRQKKKKQTQKPTIGTRVHIKNNDSRYWQRSRTHTRTIETILTCV